MIKMISYDYVCTKISYSKKLYKSGMNHIFI